MAAPGASSYRVGIIGAGGISDTHARAAQAIPGVEVVAVIGQNREKAAALARRHEARAYDDLDAFLRHRPMDLVAIGSPSGLHAEQGIQAAARGLHVLVEKPIDVNVERTDALVEACERAGVRLGVFFQDRLKPDIVRLKGLVDAGAMGRPTLADARVKWYRPPEYYAHSRWRGTWALDGGGALMNQGVHTLDLLLWLLGDVARVQARTAALLHDIEVEDTALAVLEFASGALGTLQASTAVYPGYARRIELTGTDGTLVLDGDRLAAADLKKRLREEVTPLAAGPGASAASPVVADASAHRAVIEDFLRAIETGGRPSCDGHEGRRSVLVAEAIYAASRSGQTVSLRR